MKNLGPSAPARVGPFRSLAVLGQGGMGRVLLGAGPDGRLAAVKLVHEELAEDEEFRARFRREVSASRRVAGSYVAPVLDADPEAYGGLRSAKRWGPCRWRPYGSSRPAWREPWWTYIGPG